MRYVLSLTDGVQGDTIKIEAGSWNLKVRRGDKFVVPEASAKDLLTQKIRGRPLVRVVETLE